MKHLLKYAGALLLAVALASPLSAQEKKTFSVGLGGGMAFGINESESRPLNFSGRFTLMYLNGFGKMLTPEIGVSMINLGSENIGGFSDYKTTIISPDFRLRLAPIGMNDWSPYIYALVGGAFRNVTERPFNADVDVENSGGDLTFGGGVGLYHQLSPNWAIDLNLGGNGSGGDNFNPVTDDQNDGWWQGLLNIHYIFDDGGDRDSDGDGLTNDRELALGTDPNNPDTDNDGLRDGAEVNDHSTNPLNSDSDNDGLKDGAEINEHATNANDPDTDKDGLRDGDEINKYRTKATNADTDGDNLKDGDEVTRHSTDPLKADTDGDNLADGLEVNQWKTNPLAADTDGDQLTDGEEVNTHKTNPLDTDTDKGSVFDGIEVRRGSRPLDMADDVPKRADQFDVQNVGAAIVLEGVVFDVNKATIKPASEPILTKALATMQDNPQIEVEIRGHTDNSGAKAKNIKLSADRAESVKKWLVAKGVAANRLTTRGFGPDSPIAPNDTPENKQKNRRIEFVRLR
ncbi:MAG TPA: OmpA family protein [Candidatus Kapabacteria bacterium]|nr:OmpA family protein [Candidatus Kapabacteria bacterium]